MIPSEIKVGHVLRYAYLWAWAARQGKEEGDKDRPCLVLALVETSAEGVRFVRVLPITHSPPAKPHHAVELPPSVKRRLGLDDQRSWVVLTESNRFAWPGPDLRPTQTEAPDGYYGPLPPRLFDEIRTKFLALARSGEHVPVVRTE